LVNDFLQQLRLQQLRLKVDLRSNPATRLFMEDALVNANVARLEALDRLSLHFCLNPQQDAMIDAVPVNDSGEEADLELHLQGANVVTLAPYPFRREPLSFSIMARRVPKRGYSGDLDFQKTLRAAQFFPGKFSGRARRADAVTPGAAS